MLRFIWSCWRSLKTMGSNLHSKASWSWTLMPLAWCSEGDALTRFYCLAVPGRDILVICWCLQMYICESVLISCKLNICSYDDLMLTVAEPDGLMLIERTLDLGCWCLLLYAQQTMSWRGFACLAVPSRVLKCDRRYSVSHMHKREYWIYPSTTPPHLAYCVQY